MKKLLGVLFVGTVVVFNAKLVVVQAADGFTTRSDVNSTGDNSHPASTNVCNASYPRIDPDCRVTFRLMAPNADQVQVFTNYGLGTRIYKNVRKLYDDLRQAGVKHVEFGEAEGFGHEWQTWRYALHDFAPRLFHEKQ